MMCELWGSFNGCPNFVDLEIAPDTFLFEKRAPQDPMNFLLHGCHHLMARYHINIMFIYVEKTCVDIDMCI